ncbi:MAG TPA: IclR family transcriptional regulator [Rhizobiales bacterium]|nr:IclR family transcriptional regulator [Hyphomicrobiales bacterium]
MSYCCVKREGISPSKLNYDKGEMVGIRKNTDLAASAAAPQDRQFIKSLARGFKVLSAFRAEDRGVTNAELARRTGLPKPTLSRLTFTLLSLNYLHLDEDTGRYFLHPHVLTLGYPVLHGLSVRELARPLMQELADSVRGAVVLGMRDGLSMIIIERARHRTMATWPLDIGVARDIATTAIGRAYIVALGEKERRELLEEVRADDEMRWREIERGIGDALKSYSDNGYTLSAGDWVPEYSAVGVPLKLRDGTILSFNCGGYANRLNPDQLKQMGEKLVLMTRQLEQVHGDSFT